MHLYLLEVFCAQIHQTLLPVPLLFPKDEKFRNRVLELMDEEVILKFHDKTGNASDFYEIEE